MITRGETGVSRNDIQSGVYADELIGRVGFWLRHLSNQPLRGGPWFWAEPWGRIHAPLVG
jgi:hypothetical protein